MKRILLILGFSILGATSANAQAYYNDFITQANTDYGTISNYVNTQFAKSMGFISTLGWNTPPSVFDLVSGPRVQVGVGAGADLMGLPNLNNLSLGAINLGSNFSLPAAVPFPFPVITGRIGLISGLDLGLKLLYLPLIDFSDLGFSGNYYGWGLDLRYKIMDGPTVPTVTVGVSFDTMKGSFTLGTGINQISQYTDPNTSASYAVSFTGNNNYTLAWDTKSFGAQVQVGKEVGPIYPFAAVGFQRNSGDISSTMAGSGTLTMNGQPPQSISVSATSDSPPVYFEPKFVLGFDMGAGIRWGVVAESNGTDIAGSTSFRVEF